MFRQEIYVNLTIFQDFLVEKKKLVEAQRIRVRDIVHSSMEAVNSLIPNPIKAVIRNTLSNKDGGGDKSIVDKIADGASNLINNAEKSVNNVIDNAKNSVNNVVDNAAKSANNMIDSAAKSLLGQKIQFCYIYLETVDFTKFVIIKDKKLFLIDKIIFFYRHNFL